MSKKPVETYANIEENTLLKDRTVRLFPFMVDEFGHVLDALILAQLMWWEDHTKVVLPDGRKAVRFSYRRWAAQFPFAHERRVFEAFARLKARGAIEIQRTGRVNVVTWVKDYNFEDVDVGKIKYVVVQPELARRVGLNEAIVLQQVHYRRLGLRGTLYTLSDWAPDGVLGDRASQAFRARNAHALRTGGLNRAMETQGSGKRTGVQKAGNKATTDSLAASTLRAISGASIRKSTDHAVNIENVYSAITSAGAKGVDYGRLAVGLGLPDEEVHLCVAELKAAGRVTFV